MISHKTLICPKRRQANSRTQQYENINYALITLKKLLSNRLYNKGKRLAAQHKKK